MTYRQRNRGTTAERGYDSTWQQLRKRWALDVAAGLAYCTNPVCEYPSRYIVPGTPWDGGHDEWRNPRGPEHRRCNRAAAARKRNRAAAMMRAKARARVW